MHTTKNTDALGRVFAEIERVAPLAETSTLISLLDALGNEEPTPRTRRIGATLIDVLIERHPEVHTALQAWVLAEDDDRDMIAVVLDAARKASAIEATGR